MSKSGAAPDILSLLALSREVLNVYRENGPPRFLLEIEYQVRTLLQLLVIVTLRIGVDVAKYAKWICFVVADRGSSVDRRVA
jgi:hypothetical protein